MPDSHALEHDDDREFDELLDRALASYVDQEPDSSSRVRISARLHQFAPRTPRFWLLGPITASVAALLLAFLFFPTNRHLKDRATEAPAVATASAPPAASAQLGHTSAYSGHRNLVAATRHSYNNRKPIHSHRTFRAAAPLTEEEAALLRFAQQHPDQAREVLSPPASGPLHTDPLVIPPIQIADLSASQPDAH